MGIFVRHPSFQNCSTFSSDSLNCFQSGHLSRLSGLYKVSEDGSCTDDQSRTPGRISTGDGIVNCEQQNSSTVTRDDNDRFFLCSQEWVPW